MSEELDTTIEAPEGDPEGDSPDQPDDDSAANSPGDTEPVDWEARYKATQGELTKSKQALAALGKLRTEQPRTQTPEPTEDELAALPPHLRREVEQARGMRQEMEWQQVRAQYGDPIVDAYEQAFYPAWQRDPAKPGAMMDALVAFVGHLAKGAPTTPQKPSRSQAVTPRVDANRSDAPDSADLDKKIEAAKAGKGEDRLTSFISASLKKRGLEY